LADPQFQYLKLVGDYDGQNTGPSDPDVPASQLTNTESVKEKLKGAHIPKPHQLIQKKLKKDKESKEKSGDTAATAAAATTPATVGEEEKEEEDGVYPVIKLYSITNGANHVLRGLRSKDDQERYFVPKPILTTQKNGNFQPSEIGRSC
jgi:hypothetical protein